ncbi:hypothetical protein LQF12_15145 [Ruania suaedae]|uniref:hypothetical protein n=1 Tax=Ruania suaedae TaxID=2897774 RepID=UPI001E44AAF9|nr:hypothetical protein [Ruania suaedae]UFU02800.1 hypothetical protein LQF12_15145 [Ruania suaedae]
MPATGSVSSSMPMLARGRHRNPRRGACFMELASYLAGEPWSDAPSCTDESLAHLARLVNDLSSDSARPRLARLTPGVIGLRDLGPGLQDELALIAAVHALPVAAESRQRALVVGIGRTIGVFGGYATAADPAVVARARACLAQYDGLRRWAASFTRRLPRSGARTSSGVAIMETSTRGIAEACVPDTDERLRDLLEEAIAHCRERAGLAGQEPPVLEPRHWRPRVRSA